MKFTHFKSTVWWFLVNACNHHHNWILGFSVVPQIPIILEKSEYMYPYFVAGEHWFVFCLYGLPILNISYTLNPMLFGLLMYEFVHFA